MSGRDKLMQEKVFLTNSVLTRQNMEICLQIVFINETTESKMYKINNISFRSVFEFVLGSRTGHLFKITSV